MVMATRTLTLRDGDGDTKVEVRIFSPQPEKPSGWSCRYEIDWPHGQKAMEAGGADSIQALIIALCMVGAEIYTSSYHKSGNLFYEAPGRGYGFPVSNTLRDLLIGDDAVYF
jgi:hypothetical protein